MKKKVDEIVVTMSKKKFDSLLINEKRITIAKDVLDRISLNQFMPVAGSFFNRRGRSFDSSSNIKNELMKRDASCEVCVKGALFLGFIGIVDSYNTIDLNTDGQRLDSQEMKLLEDVFTKKQLSLIETAFEGATYPWNENLTEKEFGSCYSFYLKYYEAGVYESHYASSKSRLKAICNNVINNNGTFKPGKL